MVRVAEERRALLRRVVQLGRSRHGVAAVHAGLEQQLVPVARRDADQVTAVADLPLLPEVATPA
eukprot:9304392-Heterocapsa_arctica.AAC.1